MITLFSLLALIAVASAGNMYQIGNCRYNDNTIVENGVSRSPNSTELEQIQAFNQQMRDWKMNNTQNIRDNRYVNSDNQGVATYQQDATTKPHPPCLCAANNC